MMDGGENAIVLNVVVTVMSLDSINEGYMVRKQKKYFKKRTFKLKSFVILKKILVGYRLFIVKTIKYWE